MVQFSRIVYKLKTQRINPEIISWFRLYADHTLHIRRSHEVM